jgi:hypothetical protein
MGIGPFESRGNTNGLIIYKGYIVAKWGQPEKCDMTHSVTKSFLSTVAGLALETGHIRQLSDAVHTYLPPIEWYNPGKLYRNAEDMGKDELLKPFDNEHNRKISWEHLLRQTSDWEGTLWEKPDWADRPDADASKWLTRKRNEPGSVYEYNDVRVNVLALALTSILRKPLPVFLKEKVDNMYVYWGIWVILSAILMFSVDLEIMFRSAEFIPGDILSAFGTMLIWGVCTILSKKFLIKNSALTLVGLRWFFGFLFSF